MHLIRSTRPHTVNTSGADAGQILRGVSRSNHGIRLRVAQAQKPGHDGAIEGRFAILETGENIHEEALRPLLNRPTDAGEVLDAIRRCHRGCVHVANANILVAERDTIPTPPQSGTRPTSRNGSAPASLTHENGLSSARPHANPHSANTTANRAKVIAFDVDSDSLNSLRQAFPDWEVEAKSGVTADSLDRDWSPGAAALLVVGARDQAAETLGLCRAVRGQAGRAHTTVLVLVRPAQESLVRAALGAGADSCLVLPLFSHELVSVVDRARAGNQPGRHTLDLDRAQREDTWRDEGGEA